MRRIKINNKVNAPRGRKYIYSEESQTCLEIVNSVDVVDAGHAAELETQQQVLVVFAGVLQVLPDEHEVRSERADHFGSVSEHGHGNHGTGISAGGQRQLLELGLLHPDVVVAVQPLSPEVLRPATFNFV